MLRGVEEATLLGFSLGGWIAAEMATKNVTRIGRLALIDPYGIKVGGPWDRDTQDIWFLTKEEVLVLKYADPKNGDIDYTVPLVEDIRTGSSLTNVDYRGGPFVVDAAGAETRRRSTPASKGAIARCTFREG